MPENLGRRVYEGMFLVDSGDAALWDELSKHVTGILTRSGAEIVGITRWDERKLAYTVKKRKRGTYVLAFFAMANATVIGDIERDCLLSEKVLRTLVLKADHFTVADMKMQLGEDMNEAIAQSLRLERGEKEEEPVIAVAKPVPGAADAAAAAAPSYDSPRRSRGERPMRDER
jgi:small subunit ribosomal protein S6